MIESKDQSMSMSIMRGTVNEKEVNEIPTPAKENKKNGPTKMILAFVAAGITLVLIGYLIGLGTLRTNVLEHEKISVSNSSDLVTEYKVHIADTESVTFPFTLKLGGDDVKPTWMYVPFKNKVTPQSMPGTTDYRFAKKTFKTTEERRITVSAGIDFSSSAFGSLVGSSLKIDEFSAEFETYKSSKLILGSVWLKYVLEIVTVDRSAITLTDEYIGDLKEILNLAVTDDKKQEKLIDFFSNYGYYVPLQIKMGGKFCLNFKETSEENAQKVMADIQADLGVKPSVNVTVDKNLTSYSSSLTVAYNGGAKMFIDKISQVAEWFDSIDKTNYQPIDYDVIEPIYKFFPADLKELYKKFADSIDEIYKRSYEKYQIIAYWVDTKIPTDPVETDPHVEYIYGSTPAYSNYIKTETVVKDYDVTWGWIDAPVSISLASNQKIVGFSLTSEKEWNIQHVKFEISKNPIGSSTLDVVLHSSWSRDMTFTIKLYYIDWNTLD